MGLHISDEKSFDSERVIVAVEREEKRKASQGLISEVLDYLYQSDDRALERLKQIAQAGTDGVELHDAVKQYENKSDHQQLVNDFSLGAMTSAPLMMRGGLGYAGAMGVEALESINLQRSFRGNCEAALVGAMRGGCRKFVADYALGHNQWNFAMKGSVMGAGMYVVDDFLTYENMKGSRSKPVNMGQWLTGAAISAGTGAAFGGANALLGNAIGGNAYRSMIATSGISGFASGATQELVKQVSEDRFDATRVFAHGIARGAGYAVGAIPGAHQWAAKQEEWSGYKNGTKRFQVNESTPTSEERAAALKLQKVNDSAQATDFSGKMISDIDLTRYPQSKEYQRVGRMFYGQEIDGAGLKLKLPNGEIVKGSNGDIVVLDKTGTPIDIQSSGYYHQFVENLGNGVYRSTDYWYSSRPTIRALPMSQAPQEPLFTEGNKPFDAKPGDWLLQDGKGATWGMPNERFHDSFLEVQPRSALARLLGGRALPTGEAIDTYLKTHRIGE